MSSISMTTTDWILRVGDGKNFKRSSRFNIWGISSKNSFGKFLISNIKPGDRLWFVKSKSKGLLIAVATYCSYNSRELGPLIQLTKSDEELGWYGDEWSSCDIELHYNNLYNLTKCELLTHIKGPSTIRVYNEKCRVNLPVEYNNIVRYSKITKQM